MSQKNIYCSFCGKPQNERLKLIAGPSVFICEWCIDLGVGIMLKENEIKNNGILKNMPNLNSLVQDAKGNSN